MLKYFCTNKEVIFLKANVNAVLEDYEEKEQPQEELPKPIWSGQPNTKHNRTKYDWLFIPLSWFILIIAIFWRVALKDAAVPLQIFSYILMIFSVYCLFFRNHFKKKKRSKISYEVTEEDITIIITKKKDIVVKQLALQNIHFIGYSMRKDGSGTLYFNFPKTYKDVIIMLFANSGIGRFDEKFFAFFELDDVEAFLSFIKDKLPEDLVCEKL